jgi:hypothetical protein
MVRNVLYYIFPLLITINNTSLNVPLSTKIIEKPAINHLCIIFHIWSTFEYITNLIQIKSWIAPAFSDMLPSEKGEGGHFKI